MAFVVSSASTASSSSSWACRPRSRTEPPIERAAAVPELLLLHLCVRNNKRCLSMLNKERNLRIAQT